MKKTLVLLVVLAVAFFGFSSVVMAEWSKLPADLKIVPAKAGTPGAEFSGKWEGQTSEEWMTITKEPKQNVTIVFPEMKKGGMVVVSVGNKYEQGPGAFATGDQKRVVVKLSKIWKGAIVTCDYRDDGKLDVTMSLKGRSSSTTLSKAK
jgi:hypothetical protein